MSLDVLMHLSDINIPVIAAQRGMSCQELIDKIRSENESDPEVIAGRIADARTLITVDIASSPSAAEHFISNWTPMPSDKLAREYPDYTPLTIEEIGARAVQIFAELSMRGETASLLPTPLFTLWLQSVEPAIERAAKHRAGI